MTASGSHHRPRDPGVQGVLRKISWTMLQEMGEPWYRGRTPFRKEICSTYQTAEACSAILRTAAKEPFSWALLSFPEPQYSLHAPNLCQACTILSGLAAGSYHDDLRTKPSYQLILRSSTDGHRTRVACRGPRYVLWNDSLY